MIWVLALENIMNDKDYIQRCFDLAQRGKGLVSPNPLVGCVIIKEDKIISEGWHTKYGEPHAEAMAINNTKISLAGATLYCNLEPCCHTNKKTPPCLPLIFNAGIHKVVLSNRDPNPKVSGKSIGQMRNSGIEVVESILGEQGLELNRFFFKHIMSKIPWITVKIAQSLDGKISTSHDEQTWLTGKESGKFVHGLRSEYDAVLVGAQTIIVDDPQLTVRDVEGRDPIKVIVDGNLRINENASIFKKNSPGRVYIFCSEKNAISKKAESLKQYGQVIGCTLNSSGLIDFEYILKFLGDIGIISVLVEGGQSIFSQCIESNLYDEIIILQSPKILGHGIVGVKNKDPVNLKLNNTIQFGEDCCINLRKQIIRS